jgi:hypothetical protein
VKKKTKKSSILNRIEGVANSLIDWREDKRCRHFSFITHKKKIICIGQNKPKTHPSNLINRKVSPKTGEDISNQKHTCSEFDALIKLKRLTNINTKKCNLINLRYNRNKALAFSKPCMSCVNLLKYHEFKSVLFTDKDGKFTNFYG